nr:transposase [Cohnella fermenti]
MTSLNPNKWVPSKKKFFIPVKVLSRKFRGKFLAYLKQAELQFFGTTADLRALLPLLRLARRERTDLIPHSVATCVAHRGFVQTNYLKS